MGLSSPPKNSTPSKFEPFQIVCLEHETTRLYAEVIQTVEITRICWARPLILALGALPLTHSPDTQTLNVWDLRQGSDLLLPIELFREALDIEVIPLLTQLNNLTETEGIRSTNRIKLHQFVKQVCLAYPDLFQNKIP